MWKLSRGAVAVHITRQSVLEAAASLRLTGMNTCAAARLIRALCDESLSADELSLRLERHPVSSARVLRIANSPFYGQQRTVTTIRRAGGGSSLDPAVPATALR